MNAVALAEELLAAADAARCIVPPASRPEGLTMVQACEVARELQRLRSARGEHQLGWKIGFTNRSIWPRYGVYAPIWGPVWDSTTELLAGTHAELSLRGLCQPRLEPEIVFGFARAPQAGLTLEQLRECIDWVAHGFEGVHTHCEGWRFAAADCMADFALHGRLRVGPRVAVRDWPTLGEDLAALRVELHGDGVLKDQGQATVVLDGPLQALKIWIDAMAQTTPWWQVRPGDIVTTGTITDAWPLVPGQRWHTVLSDPRLSPLTVDTLA